jgi:hypothetical protein
VIIMPATDRPELLVDQTGLSSASRSSKFPSEVNLSVAFSLTGRARFADQTILPGETGPNVPSLMLTLTMKTAKKYKLHVALDVEAQVNPAVNTNAKPEVCCGRTELVTIEFTVDIS